MSHILLIVDYVPKLKLHIQMLQGLYFYPKGPGRSEYIRESAESLCICKNLQLLKLQNIVISMISTLVLHRSRRKVSDAFESRRVNMSRRTERSLRARVDRGEVSC